MELVRIFALEPLDGEPAGLFAVRYDGEEEDCFNGAFRQLAKEDHVGEFLENNRMDLFTDYFRRLNLDTIPIMIGHIAEQAVVFQKTIRSAERNQGHPFPSLESEIFEPLYPHDISGKADYQTSKAKPSRKPNAVIRIYAIRLNRHCYVVTGHAIKLTKDMNRPHLQAELNKLRLVRNWLLSGD